MIELVSKTGGHLAAGLGAVELATVLHYVFDTPRDRLIWDVGHQGYPHKLLTGRRRDFMTIGQGYGAFTKEVREAGIMKEGAPLQGVDTATTVRVRGGKTDVIDGPFAETKEVLGGYYVLECENLDDAIAYAAKIPSAEFGSIEIRPVLSM